MKGSTKSWEERFVLVENDNHLWQVAKVIDGKYNFFDNLVYLDSKYAVFFIDNKQKIINLQTKQVIEIEDKVDKIVNDIAITYNKQKIIDLKTLKNLMPDNCIVTIVNKDYFIVKNTALGKCGLFDSKINAFIFPPIYSYIEVNEKGTYLLLEIENGTQLKLYDLKNYKFIRFLDDHTLFFKDNYLANDINEVYKIDPLEKIDYNFQSPVKVFSDYAIETFKIKNDIYISRVIDLKIGKLAINKSFDCIKYDLIINGDYLIIVSKRNAKKTKIYNLKTKQYLKIDSKEKGLKGILEKEIDISSIGNEDYYFYTAEEETLNNLVFFIKKKNKIEVYNPVTQEKIDIMEASHYRVLSPGAINMYNGSNRGIYAPFILNKYIKRANNSRVIELGSQTKKTIFNTPVNEDSRLGLVIKNLKIKKNIKTNYPERIAFEEDRTLLPEMVRIRKK